jgi:hypothetical protein
MSPQTYEIAADALREAIEQALRRGDDQGPWASSLTCRTRPAKLSATLGKLEAERLRGFLDRHALLDHLEIRHVDSLRLYVHST